MVRHLILWELKDEYSEEQKAEIKKKMKEEVEALVGQVPGLLEMHVQIEGLATSNADVLLDSVLADERALQGYAVHPVHVHVADTFVRPYVKGRHCMDFEV